MQFGWFDVATVLHEFCHALGLGHEHQNPYGIGIDWNQEKVYEWARKTQGWDKAKTNSNIIVRYSKDLTIGTSYDPDSIMLYFYDGTLTKNGIGTKPNLRLSLLDVHYLASKYPNNNQSPEKAVNLYRIIYEIPIPTTTLKPVTTLKPITPLKPVTTLKPITPLKPITLKPITPLKPVTTFKQIK